MKFDNLRKYFPLVFMFAILSIMWGCGSDGGTVANESTSKSASLSVISSGSSEYIIQGNNMDGVAGIYLTISYDSAVMTAPAVTEGGVDSGSLIMANTNVPGTIKIAIINGKSFSGSGPIAKISFATQSGASGISISSASMSDIKGAPVP